MSLKSSSGCFSMISFVNSFLKPSLFNFSTSSLNALGWQPIQNIKEFFSPIQACS